MYTAHGYYYSRNCRRNPVLYYMARPFPLTRKLDIKRSSFIHIWKSFAHLSSHYFHTQSYFGIHVEWRSKWFSTKHFGAYSSYLGTQISIAIALSAKCCICCGNTQYTVDCQHITTGFFLENDYLIISYFAFSSEYSAIVYIILHNP